MRTTGQLAAAAIAAMALSANITAQAGSIAGRAGDIGRSVSKVVHAGEEPGGARDEAGEGNAIPLPALRYISLSNPPLPKLRGDLQLASLGNPYLAAMPTLIKPRVLKSDPQPTASIDKNTGKPRPRFITWSRGRTEEAVIPGGRRQACFHCLLRRKAEKHGVPFRLARAVVMVESNYRRDAVGGVGEIGLMQIRPQTARWLGFDGEDAELFNPRKNLEYGVKYLGKAWRLGEGSLCRVILKYNAGHNAKRMNPMSKRYCNKVQKILKNGAGPIRQASL